jgi:hypothetical protein
MSKKIKFCPNCGSIVGAYVQFAKLVDSISHNQQNKNIRTSKKPKNHMPTSGTKTTQPIEYNTKR